MPKLASLGRQPNFQSFELQCQTRYIHSWRHRLSFKLICSQIPLILRFVQERNYQIQLLSFQMPAFIYPFFKQVLKPPAKESEDFLLRLATPKKSLSRPNKTF
jgi:hypothetical protein